MSESVGGEAVVWDATAPRHLALVGSLDVLIAVTGFRAPRIVADPSEPTGDDLLITDPSALSELSAAEWHFLQQFRRHGDLADFVRAERLAAARRHSQLIVIDLTAVERDDFEVFASDGFVHRHNLLAPLGRGERAVIAVAANRGWTAGLDDGAARNVATALGVAVITTQQLFIRAITQGHLSESAATELYGRLLEGGFYGSPDLGFRATNGEAVPESAASAPCAAAQQEQVPDHDHSEVEGVPGRDHEIGGSGGEGHLDDQL